MVHLRLHSNRHPQASVKQAAPSVTITPAPLAAATAAIQLALITAALAIAGALAIAVQLATVQTAQAAQTQAPIAQVALQNGDFRNENNYEQIN